MTLSLRHTHVTAPVTPTPRMRSRQRLALARALALTLALTAANAVAPANGVRVPAAVERILYLSPSTEASDRADVALLRAKLAAAGFGAQHLQVVWRHVSFDVDVQMREVRAALAEGPTRLVIAASLDSARAVQLLTGQLPIVFAGSADPVLACLADTLQRPGRNATGLTTALRAEAKMLEALHDAYPRLQRWVVLIGAEEADSIGCDDPWATTERQAEPPCIAGPVARPEPLQHELDVAQITALGRRLGQPVTFYRVCSVHDIDVFAARTAQQGATGVIVPLYLLFHQEAAALIDRLNRARLPSVYDRRHFAERGGLMAVSPRADPAPMATAFDLAIQVLEGADPANLPVRAPNGFELWFNVRTARDIDAAPSLRSLARADRLVN